MRRTNFFAELVSDLDRTGIRNIIDELRSNGREPEEGVDMCLDLMGSIETDDKARAELVDHLAGDGGLSWDGDKESRLSEERVTELLQLIVSLREFQFA